jgi:hypothetical protein
MRLKMLKKFMIVLLILGVQVSCSSKKKGFPLFILMLGGGGTGGDTSSVAASSSTIDSAENGTSFTAVPVEEFTTNTGNTTENTNSTDSNPSPFVPQPGATNVTQVSSNINFQVVNDTFQWDNTISTYITIRVSNEDGILPGITVKVSEDQSTVGLVQFLSQGTTGSDGQVTIRITVRPNVSEVIVTVFGINPKNGQAQELTGRIPIQVPSSSVAGGGGLRK